jgi:hypothetical protein
MGIYQRGNIWWYKFKKEARPYYKSSESTDPEEAQGLLRIAQGDVARGKTRGIFNQVTLDDLPKTGRLDFSRWSLSRAFVAMAVKSDSRF